ncbi:nucleoside 2-deoxyribosyltransferase domain-containing protein [Macrococcus capreoli]|uniref:nucleoside 2-deoxyribosyltransferase domain-containing protein n=1 Tax=Macrococcus capreoli TaxID=2982690 RepID=UPI0021D5ECAE|nr:nucleoside 2-deoxyribosyltransferase domain-containing protein [Macrococcus sp. TMW 2.2395]MCU7556558.1 nucleoside 2-deoxyribosyltransferase domain-containing protein [Macrococcus sp. TMW 2.2395]
MTNKQVYLAGDLLTYGAQRQRAYEAEEIRKIGVDVYAPQEDASINDKANAVQEGLAERIVNNDTQGIMSSDIIVIDVHENGKGTLVELGQIKGMKDMATIILGYFELANEGLLDKEDVLYAIEWCCTDVVKKRILPHNTDIRRLNTSSQSGDRREYGVNQYVYGTVLDLTDGYGFYEFDEVLDELKTLKDGEY